MPHTLTEQAENLLSEISAIQKREMGPPEEWDSAGRDIFDCAQQMLEIIQSLDTQHRLIKLEDAVRELNPGINI